ncbi:CHAP domain-containing protein [Candidatus Saccharibacteria bacterium]|nr:CHAP domain-containing protein [Candidatus Saccharibacteria bacterium]
MTKNKLKFTKNNLARTSLSLVAVTAIVISSIAGYRIVDAQSVREQIESLEAENQSNRNKVEELKQQATSYEDAIGKLEAQIDDIERKIQLNTEEQDRLKVEIAKVEAELEEKRQLLGKNIRAMYIAGDISTIEMLASSNDLSEFVDKQQYRDSIKTEISTTVNRITALKHELRAQREQVDKLLKEQTDQREDLADSRKEQTRLLSFNQNQQADFNAKTKENQKKIEELIASQIQLNNSAANLQFIRIPGPVNGHNISVDDYPYKGYGHSQIDEPCFGPPRTADSLDRWYYCTRQCTSYVAWAIERSGRSAPRGWGDAKNWVNMAPASWMVSAPRTGDIAVVAGGTWGHVMYVESVENGRMLVSEYNINLTGHYNYRWINLY